MLVQQDATSSLVGALYKPGQPTIGWQVILAPGQAGAEILTRKVVAETFSDWRDSRISI